MKTITLSTTMTTMDSFIGQINLGDACPSGLTYCLSATLAVAYY